MALGSLGGLLEHVLACSEMRAKRPAEKLEPTFLNFKKSTFSSPTETLGASKFVSMPLCLQTTHAIAA